MKNMTKHILLAALFTAPVWSAPEAGDQNPGKPALTIAPFTMKSSDGKMEFRMDENGKLFAVGKHIATAHAEGKLTSPDGELIFKLNEKGIVVNQQGQAGEDPAEITEDGTWKQAGVTFQWADGKLDFGDGRHLTLEPKNSPAKRAATLAVMQWWRISPRTSNAERP